MVSLAEIDSILSGRKETQEKIDTEREAAVTAADIDAILQSRAQETPQAQALRLGAIPGVAVTPEQQAQIAAGERIEAPQRTLTERAFQPVPETEAEDPLLRSFEQGLLNIGGGIARGFGELRAALGDEEANQFLQELSISQAMEQEKTRQITEEAPVSRFVGEVAGETVGFGVGGPGKSLATRLLTGAAAGGTGGALSAAGRGEAAEDIATEAAIAGVLSPAAEAVGAFARRFKVSREAKRVGDIEAEEAAIAPAAEELIRGQQIVEETGIRLLPAQKTLDPFQREQQAFLGQNPQVSRKAFDVLTTQNREAATAVGNLLDQIAAPEAVGTAAEKARRAANNIINAKVIIRKEKASPLYNNAFGQAQEEGKRVDVQPLVDSINARLENFAEEGPSGKLLQRVKKMIGGPDVDEVAATVQEQQAKLGRANLRRMHNVKMEIDELITREKDKGNLGPTVEAELLQIQEEFVGQMDALGVGYDLARAEFARLSPAIDELRSGVFGRLSTINDRSLKQSSSVLFDAAETNPQVMKQAIASLKGVEGGQDIARALLRTELEKRLGRLPPGTEEAAREALENVPAKLNKAIFGNTKQRNLFFAALEELSPEAKKNAEWLEEGLRRAGLGRPGGSQTAIRQEIIRKLDIGVVSSLRNFIRGPVTAITGVGEEVVRSQRARALGDALYNPDWAPDMEKISKLAPNSGIAGNRFTALLNRILDFNEKTGAARRVAPVAGRIAIREENE